MPSWGSFSYAYGPTIAFFAMGLIILLLRWTFGRGQLLMPPAPKRGNPNEYGLLVPIAHPTNFVEGELLRRTLEAEGIRSNLAVTNLGPRVMVFPEDAERAKELLKQGR